MGIRFLCPNGHKLNVKAFLAGKRGICPECDARFIVPEASGGKAVAVDLVGDVRSAEPATTSVDPNEALPTPTEQGLPVESFSLKVRRSRLSSRQERAWKITFIMGALTFLLAVALVLVLWYQ